ncbi:hypothetical protein UF75_3961 [Desulfosporosinus sp. I2]|nr:hypothetical protein UF75_3961 [Desulfosporosinus sp. I2]
MAIEQTSSQLMETSAHADARNVCRQTPWFIYRRERILSGLALPSS